MGWSGSLSANSAVGSAITYTPDTTSEGGYNVVPFTAPKKGIYAFVVKGSGGTYYSSDGASAAGGTGGLTVGYLLLEAGQTVYIGAGGTCSAAFVSKVTGSALKNIAAANLYFVAGAGGGGGAMWGQPYNMKAGSGGVGGGTTGGVGNSAGIGSSGSGGTQSSGYGYGHGGGGGYSNSDDTSFHAGRGGDGYYGGTGASGSQGGGGGSGYIHASTLKVNTKTFANSTQQGGGAGSDSRGSIQVSYHARAELPVIFNGTTLERLFFNGVEVESLIYDGVKLFFRKLRRWGRCLNSAEPVSA